MSSSKCKIIKEEIINEIEQLASTSKIDMKNILDLAKNIPCRKITAYNSHISQCMKQEKGTMKECASKWPEKKALLAKEKRAEEEVQPVPTVVSGEGIRAEASYHPQTGTTIIATVDEDPDKIQIIASTTPIKAEKVIVEELPDSGVTAIKIEGEGEQSVTVVSDLPLYKKE